MNMLILLLVRVALAPKIKIGIDPCGETHAVLNVWVRHSVVLLVGICLFAQQATKDMLLRFLPGYYSAAQT